MNEKEVKKKLDAIINKIPPTFEEFLNPKNGYITQKIYNIFKRNKKIQDLINIIDKSKPRIYQNGEK